LEGFFWFPRTLLGIQDHLYAFYDQPELMHRMNQDLANYHVQVLRQLAAVCRPAFMTFAEDMSYNHGPMLSRGLFEEFLAPYYCQVIPLLREMGTRVIIDSDGDVTEMVPWLRSVGIEGVLPLERQAGVDAAELRRAFPRFLMIGHYDKMVMARGETAMRAEFERLLPVMRQGGFIPSVDHQTPPGVSLDQYRVYLRLLEEYTETVGS
jgi:uroporphyrinogen-III decarboxylase